MTDAQKRLARLQVEQSEKRECVNALVYQESRTDDETAELDEVTKRLQAIEPELRAALVLVSGEDDAATETEPDGLDAETRERLELRAKASVTRYVEAALRGRLVAGAEAEYMAACGVDEIPLELFELDPRENRDKGDGEQRADATTPHRIRSASIFSRSVQRSLPQASRHGLASKCRGLPVGHMRKRESLRT